jgi:hypothetical protein
MWRHCWCLHDSAPDASPSQVLAWPMIICRRVLGAQVLRDVVCAHRAEGDKDPAPRAWSRAVRPAWRGPERAAGRQAGRCRRRGGFGDRQHHGGLTHGVRGQGEPGLSGQPGEYRGQLARDVAGEVDDGQEASSQHRAAEQDDYAAGRSPPAVAEVQPESVQSATVSEC